MPFDLEQAQDKTCQGVHMSFEKAIDLLKLAEMAAARHIGVSLSDITEEFGCTYRTAQRMTRALEQTFTGVVTHTDDEQRKYWALQHRDLRLLAAQGLGDGELVALEMSIRRAERDGATNEVDALRRVRDRLLAAMPKPHARRTESDAEAILEALGFACRPGPKVTTNERLLSTIAAALRGPFLLSVVYGLKEEDGPARLIEPYGLLLGIRKYLVGKIQGEDDRMRHFRLDRIHAIQIEAQSFNRDPEFNLEDHAARAFASFQSDEEYGEVIWRFRPDAAPVAREFVFHPRQELVDDPDGSLLVRFHASGHLEMAWHLYMWGDAVEVLAPEPLRAMVERHRRGDFPALP
jgi:predicted DNA-binding transcriptional regulator YafY